jgi:hypothetical protein
VGLDHVVARQAGKDFSSRDIAMNFGNGEVKVLLHVAEGSAT